MYDLETDDPSPAEVLGQLEARRLVRTPFAREWPDGRERQVYLRCGDHVCSECDGLIPPDCFGENAPMLMILGRQKLKYGNTYCADCLEAVQ